MYPEITVDVEQFIQTNLNHIFQLLYTFKNGYEERGRFTNENPQAFIGLAAILISIGAQDSLYTYSQYVPIPSTDYLGDSQLGCSVKVNTSHFQPFCHQTISGLSVIGIKEVPDKLLFMSQVGTTMQKRGDKLWRYE